MHKILTAFVGLVVIVQLSEQASKPTDNYYQAGVVEFRPAVANSSLDRVNDNLNGYLEIIASTEAENLDIIVFPESTLNNNDHQTFVPNPLKELIVPCDAEPGQYHDFLVQLSCAARKAAKYIVINLTEKEWCTTVPEDQRPCSSSGLNTFNTNVVFDRAGAVISRYRKVHLYSEEKNTTLVPELAWFDTDFGVRFGHFICFDILFYTPAQAMVEVYGIKDFIFPTMWFSQLPFLTGVQVHQAWSYTNDVNLLAAGASYPSVGSTGSGIYNGRKGFLVAKMHKSEGVRTLYVSRVPKYRKGRHMAKRSTPAKSPTIRSKPDISLKRDYLENYETAMVDLSKGTSLSQELCFNNSAFCCSFDLSWQTVPLVEDSHHYLYRLGVFDGMRNEEASETNELKNCAVFSCSGPSISDCGQLLDINTDVIFKNITITAKFPQIKCFLIMPNSLREEDLLPVPVKDFEWSELEKEDHKISIRYSLKTTTRNVMAFSIYGNYYESDDPQCWRDDGNDGAGSIGVSVICLVVALLINTHFL